MLDSDQHFSFKYPMKNLRQNDKIVKMFGLKGLHTSISIADTMALIVTTWNAPYHLKFLVWDMH